ncbi:MAG: hypothetical protein HWD92_09740 [Flavobacteriia bacterium]|nr:hypothetical protein [Flavobacteriia bacterium]
MKRSLFIVSFLCFSILAIGQGTPDALGRVYKIAEEGANPQLWGQGTFSYFTVVGDTLINGNSYMLVECSQAGVDEIPGGIQSIYFSRQVGDVLYVRFDSSMFAGGNDVQYNVDIPLIDYSLQVGDTMTTNIFNGSASPVDMVDTVTIGNTEHRRIWIGGDEFTEGYGSASYPLSKWFTNWHYSNMVVCITDSSGQILYEPRVDLNPPADCSYVLSKEEFLPAEFKVWQRDGVLIVEGEIEEGDIIEMLSIDGRLIQNWDVYSTDRQEFTLPTTAPGLYLLKFSDSHVQRITLE